MQSSTQRAAAGRPIELEATGGTVARSTATHEIPVVPVTARLVEQPRVRGLASMEVA